MVPLPSSTADANSFAYDTARVRWPKILRGCIDDLPASPADAVAQIAAAIGALLDEIASDKTIAEFSPPEVDQNPDLAYYNRWLAAQHQKVSWLHGSWLFLECYLYQRLHQIFAGAGLPDLDIFSSLKQSTLVSSEAGIVELCKKIPGYGVGSVQNRQEKLILFKEFIDISLWGNATDLSLLAGNVTLDDMKSIQGEQVRRENEKNILVNDTTQIFEYLESTPPGRVDIILDNSGFELFSDLTLAVFLLDMKLADQIVFHTKKIPWFVSDVMNKDFDELFSELASFRNEHVDSFVDTVKALIQKGTIVVKTHAFWTLSYEYWHLDLCDDLYKDLRASNLLVFKGDLNYRKLTGDLQWPKTTPFKEAICGLAALKLPVVTLRTCKADVVVSLPPGKEQQLVEADGEGWAATGKYAVVNFFHE